MGNLTSCLKGKEDKVEQAASKAVDAAAQNKDKVVAGIKDAGAKAGVSQGAVDTAANKVDEALTNKEDLKAKVSSALGGDGAAAAPAAPAEAAA